MELKRRLMYLTAMLLAFSAVGLTGCQQKDPEPGDIAGYDEGESYLSIWVHSIEDTEEGQAYKESVETFNEAYDGKYFADIEFVPRNDSGGGYSDKVNASVMAGGLPDVLTVDGPNISAYAARLIINILAFILTFVIITVVMRAIIFALDIVANLPVLGFFNRLGGALLGAAGGLIIVWILFMIITMLYTTSFGREAYDVIQGNDILRVIYEYNPVLKMAVSFK